jgi:long-chain-fatty-acid--[acyl-carrier-protein] ligase
MIDLLVRFFGRLAIWLRYRVAARGLQAVAAKGTRGILFLPNHPALIDPIIIGVTLMKTFRARFLADEQQIDRFFIRNLARLIRVIPIPDPGKLGPAARQAVEQGLARCVEALRDGDNVVIYPAGRIMRSRYENLRGNSALRWILDQLPDVRIVLVRDRGLWGSGFSYALGRVPSVGQVLRKGIMALLACGVFFAPRRPVDLEFVEAALGAPHGDELPRNADRGTLNRWLEQFYNAGAPAATYVPYTFWQRGGIRNMPEPNFASASGDISAVPETTRQTVLEYLRERTGVADVRDELNLASDLGLDSLARAEMLTWLAGEFGYPPGDVESLQTVGDVLLAAGGQAVSARLAEMKPIPAKWLSGEGDWLRSPDAIGTKVPVPGVGLRTSPAPGQDEQRGQAPPNSRAEPVPCAEALDMPDGATIPEVFLAQARRGPGRPILADQASGMRTYRDVVLGVMVLCPLIERMPGGRVGILLPAGVAADIVYMATLLAGKTPVMVNWTVGARNLEHCLSLVGVKRVVTARRLVERLKAQGVDLAPAEGMFAHLEDLAGGAGKLTKLAAALASRLSWSSLDKAAARLSPAAPAVILFTSGSEALPKAVPLTHANILANVRDIAALEVVRRGDRLLGILPPFHSFGLTVTTVLPLCLGAPVAHHPDPTEAATLARVVEAYRTTIMVGTPTFLDAIARAATAEQVSSLRLAVTGAEKCPERTYDRLERVNPKMEVLEGYGVTECSPIVSVNRPGRSRRGTIGEPMASVQWAIVDVETQSRRVEPGSQGMLLVRGPSVFGGYMHYDGPSPFVEFDGRQWYRTGDLVVEESGGVLRFSGRLKRFVKMGGEMISLPAIESVLAGAFEPTPDVPADAQAGQDRATPGPSLAVEAAGQEGQAEIVLFTTRPLGRDAVNRAIRDAGLSPLHNVRRVIQIDEIPVLGTGKCDYRELKRRLAEGRGKDN